MELALLKLVALLRPLGSIAQARVVFDIVGVGLFVLMIAAFLSNTAIRQTVKLTAIDAVIVLFALWCLSVDLIYFDSGNFLEMLRALSKVLIPLLTYIVVKSVVRDTQQYASLLFWILVGFTVPLVWSAAAIASGGGVEYIAYWTELPRYEGVYEGAHSLGHSMTLFVMVLVLYFGVARLTDQPGESRRKIVTWAAFVVFLPLALYCLYMSQVRSAILGLVVFFAIYLLYYNRKLLFVGVASLAVTGVFTIPLWLPTLLPEFAVRDRGVEVTTMDLGSGRPRMWKSDLQVFADLPIDRQIAGAGLGNRPEPGANQVFYGHNDWLEVLTQTGIIGLGLFLALQILILRAILRIPGREKYMYLAMFAAVEFMMTVSNSYLWRIQVSHLYYIVLAFIELSPRTARVGVEQGRQPLGTGFGESPIDARSFTNKANF
jgi:O-antigen ligase